MCEDVLLKEISTLKDYFYKWRLQPNPSKTNAIIFHFNNKQAAAKLKIKFDGHYISHNKHPKYLGITLDRTLKFK